MAFSFNGNQKYNKSKLKFNFSKNLDTSTLTFFSKGDLNTRTYIDMKQIEG